LTIVGDATDSHYRKPFIWTLESGLVTLGFLPNGIEGYATAFSDDGQVITGTNLVLDSKPNNYSWHAFRWTRATGTMEDLGHVTASRSVTPTGISADGRVIVGTYIKADGYACSFKWSAARGIEGIGCDWNAQLVSKDGDVIFGVKRSSPNDSALNIVRWTEKEGQVELDLGKNDSQILSVKAIDADGGVIVGEASSPTHNNDKRFVYRWTTKPLNGNPSFQSIEDWLTSNGADSTGLQATDVSDVSGDGNVVVGQTIIPDDPLLSTGFVAKVGANR
jgi:uncharacterized membrane protein